MKKSGCLSTLFLICGFYTLNIQAAEYSTVLEWANRTSLSVPVSGVIADIKAQEGQHVKQGSVLVSLDKRYFEAKLMAARALVSRYRPGRDEAKRELDRALELYDRTVLSQVELDTAKNDYAEKQALYINAQANHKLADLDMEYSQLKAPYDLVVIRPLVNKGQTVVNDYQAIPLIEVADAGHVQVSMNLKLAEADGIKLGSTLDVTIKGSKYQGRVVRYDVNSNTSRILVSIIMSDRSNKLGVGQTVTLKW